jgi:long-subunit acyl-CoA synthetase (AMP-forming)
MLSIIASRAIALPLAPFFTPKELRYIVNNSQAKMFVASEKHRGQCSKVLEEGIDMKPYVEVVDEAKAWDGILRTPVKVTLEDSVEGGGMMLYTSGTTAAPVSTCNIS